jgi:hypothetical protein
MQKTYEKPALRKAASLGRITAAYGISYCYRYYSGVESAVAVQEAVKVPEECLRDHP